MHGYRNFASDVKLAFEVEIKSGELKVKHEEWFGLEFCHSVILEGEFQYLKFYIDGGNLILMIVDKRTSYFTYAKEVFNVFYPTQDFQKEKEEYFKNPFYEAAKAEGKDINHLVKMISDHYVLDELLSYSVIYRKSLIDIVQNGLSWTEKFEKLGRVLYKTSDKNMIS